MKKNMKLIVMIVVLFLVLVFFGCGVMSIVIKKCNLEVKMQMSEMIWLELFLQKIVYLQIKNILDKNMFGLVFKIIKVVQDKGYIVIFFLEDVYYWIQVNVLKVDKMDLCEVEGFLSQGYQGVVLGVVLGVGIIGYNFNLVGVMLGVGLVVGFVGMVVDVMIEDINYIMVMDVQIFEKMDIILQIDNVVVLKQGIFGYKVQISIQMGNKY